MCGIAGLVAPFSAGHPRPVLSAMAKAIEHRGPDDEGFLEAATRDGRHWIGLAHRRLSIIDLSTGHQPIGNEDGTVQVVFNGEIYNFEGLRDELIGLGHRFVTRSDTETIVHAYEQWGPECVARFRGMFAFAIWDAARERLFIARDRFGKKPVFIAQRQGWLVFGSEIKALLRAPCVEARVDEASIHDYFAYRYVPGPATLFDGIRKLMPGSWAIWENGALTEHCWYQPPDREPRRGDSSDGDAVGGFIAKLDEAVRVRMISDVPFGAFLSGGIDSSAVVALMSRHSSQPVKTFSVGFAESSYSELGYAKTIADHFGTDHRELTVSQDDLMAYLPALVRYRDAPVAEPSDVPIYLLSKAARESVKMVLTGEGSDEFLGGYPKHSMERFAQIYQRLPRVLRRGLIEPTVRSLPYRYRRIKTAAATLGLEDRASRMIRWFGAMTPAEVDRLIALPRRRTADLDRPPFDVAPGNSALRGILYFDQTSWLPDNLLERGDRMTMAASLEARMPFMDHELAAYVSALPDRWRVRGRISKVVLRDAMARLLPSAILERPKVGFRVPVNEWFRGRMKDYLREHLLSSQSMTRRWYREPALRGILDEHFEGRQNHEKLIWAMLTLEIWHREYLPSA
jgi:asparagine synthase (glutamine-hydrolysing)